MNEFYQGVFVGGFIMFVLFMIAFAIDIWLEKRRKKWDPIEYIQNMPKPSTDSFIVGVDRRFPPDRSWVAMAKTTDDPYDTYPEMVQFVPHTDDPETCEACKIRKGHAVDG